MDDPREIEQGEDATSKQPEDATRRNEAPIPTAVDVHPLVLLSVVDHYNRINTKAATSKRVVGLLLGNVIKGDNGEPRLDVTTCFAVPFDEDPKDAAVWFLDVNYAEDVWMMYRKVLPRIKVVGWYSSGPDIGVNDVDIHLIVAERFCRSPIYGIVNADPAKKGAPVTAYTTTESRLTNGNITVEFRNIHTNLGAVEAEEIGVEHLLRDLTDSTISNLSTKIDDRQLALLQLESMLGSIETYLRDVAAGRLPVCAEILHLLQEVNNTAPLVHQLKTSQGTLVATNDAALATMLASMARAVTALYDVISNRRTLKRLAEERRTKAAAEAKAAETKAAENAAKDQAAPKNNEEAKTPGEEAKK